MKRMRCRFWKIAMVISAIVLVSCKQKTVVEEGNTFAAYEINYTGKVLSSSYSASVRGKLDIDIFPQVSGYITGLYVEEGSKVKKGQTLFIIDQVPYEAALRTSVANVDVAKANVETAKITYESKKELYDKNVISKFDLQMAENALASAKAQLEQMLAQEINARNNLSYTVVKSPADGVVSTLPFREGALVSPSQGKALTRVSDNSEMYVYFSMTENQLLQLIREYGSLDKAIESMPAVQLQLSDKSMYPEEGAVKAISGVIEQSTGAVSVKAVFPNKNGLLHSGGSANVIIPQHKSDCMVIPKSATFEIQDKKYVYCYVDGMAKSVRIEVDPLSDDNEYIVLNGLKVGDVIITEGVGFIRDNTPVKIK